MRNLRNSDNLQVSETDGTIFTRINCVGAGRIHLAHGKYHSCECCNKYGPKKYVFFFSAETTLVSRGSKHGAVADYSEHSIGPSTAIK